MDVFMALFDFVPVFAFLFASLFLQRDLYNKMSKGAFAVFSAGTIFVFAAGVLKAIYKLLFYTNLCDFEALNSFFFPAQTIGFVLAGAGTLAMVVHPQGEYRAYGLLLPAFLLVFLEGGPIKYSGTMLFVILMVLGVLVYFGSLFFIAIKNKCILASVLLVVAFIGILGMGYLATRADLSDWIKEIVNTIGQGSYLFAAIVLRKHGLGDYNYKVFKEDFKK